MSVSSVTPGKSLESDLRLIREARGLTREDVYNRVRIRPEVLSQVEEHGFSATPTLSSEIHRRSFVKHYADAVEISAEVALAALKQSIGGFYDGSLAVEYLGLTELNPIPRWAQESDSGGTEESSSPLMAESLATESELESAAEKSSSAATTEPTPDQDAEPEHQPEPEQEAEYNVVPEDSPVLTEPVSDEPAPVEEPTVVAEPTVAEEPMVAEEPTVAEESTVSDESDTAKDESAVEEGPLESETRPSQVSPYAPPMPGDVQEDDPVSTEATKVPDAPVLEEVPDDDPRAFRSPPLPDDSVHETAPSFQRAEVPHIPSSTLKESVIGLPDDDDFGDEEPPWAILRGRHWVTWVGLTGVVVAILLFSLQAFMGGDGDELNDARITSVAELPNQFTGIIRLSPTTERFVTLQISPSGSDPTTNFVYKMWTLSAGSTFAETGEGSLNTAGNQILLGEPYGVGGLFVVEGGSIRLRSVRRVRFPRWEFTGRLE